MKELISRKIVVLLSYLALSLLSDAIPAAAVAEHSGLAALVQLLGQVDDASIQFDLLKGMSDALEGRRDVKMPPAWPDVYARLAGSSDRLVRERATRLALIFGDKKAIESLRRTMIDADLPTETRRDAVSLLASSRIAGLEIQLFQLLADPRLRGDAIRGLAAYDHPQTPRMLLGHYERLSPVERGDVIQTLVTRPAYAAALLDAVERGIVAQTDVSAFAARQIETLDDPLIRDRLKTIWGDVQKTSQQQEQTIQRYKRILTDQFVDKADLHAGRMLFDKSCKSCHMLYGEGGQIGPDITGGNRDNLDYILENILAPSAVVPLAYQMNVLVTIEGRVLNGIIVAQTPQTIALQTVNERLVIDRDDIQQLKPSPLSMMPDGLLEKMTQDEVRDLIGYLRTKRPLPPE